jgi:uncharacterized protein (UPF0332 family)
MFLIDVKECFEKGLLKESVPSSGLARKSLKQAEFFLKESKDLVKISKEEMAVIALYNAFFHAARGLLFRDGISERSHFCLARYIEEMYVNKHTLDSRFLDHLNVMRDLRHEAQYTLNEIIIDEDLKSLCTVCDEFIKVVRGLTGGSTS